MLIKIENVSVYNNFDSSNTKTNVYVEDGVVTYVGNNIKKDVDKVIEGENLAILPNFEFLNFEQCDNYNIFNLNNLSEESLEKQLDSFKNDKLTFMFLENPTELEGEYDVIVPFCKKHNIKIVAVAGRTLNEMGECDKMHGVTPIGYLEEFGVLDLEPIILSAANLEKEDLEKLSYYNATICLSVTFDWLNGNGLAQMPLIKKYNLNVMFECSNIFKEIYSAYFLPAGYLKIANAIDCLDVLNCACFGLNKAINVNKPVCEVGKQVNFMVVNNFSGFESFVLNGKDEQIVCKFRA